MGNAVSEKRSLLLVRASECQHPLVADDFGDFLNLRRVSSPAAY
jgi:hypothetical protein